MIEGATEALDCGDVVLVQKWLLRHDRGELSLVAVAFAGQVPFLYCVITSFLLSHCMAQVLLTREFIVKMAAKGVMVEDEMFEVKSDLGLNPLKFSVAQAYEPLAQLSIIIPAQVYATVNKTLL